MGLEFLVIYLLALAAGSAGGACIALRLGMKTRPAAGQAPTSFVTVAYGQVLPVVTLDYLLQPDRPKRAGAKPIPELVGTALTSAEDPSALHEGCKACHSPLCSGKHPVASDVC